MSDPVYATRSYKVTIENVDKVREDLKELYQDFKHLVDDICFQADAAASRGLMPQGTMYLVRLVNGDAQWESNLHISTVNELETENKILYTVDYEVEDDGFELRSV